MRTPSVDHARRSHSARVARARTSSPFARLWRAASRLLRRTPAPLGPRGERHAACFLRRAGYKVIARNLRIGPGEADLVAIAPDRRTLVIVEVKTRLVGGPHPEPEKSITARKRAKLLGVARAVRSRARWRGRPIRIDVIAIDWPAGKGKPAVRHFQNAVIQGR